MSHRQGRSHWFVLVAAIGSVSLTACGDGRPRAYPVTGQVRVAGQPALDAIVIFHPDASDEQRAKLRPHGTVDANGQFELTTYVPSDGAPAGSYRVTVTWPGVDPNAGVDAQDPEYRPSGPDRLKGRYANPGKTPLRATITTDNNVLPPFELK
jgi:hypothetical protein